MQEFLESVRVAIGSVLTQCSGSSWSVQWIESSEQEPYQEITVSVSGNLNGKLAFRFNETTGAMLAQALLMSAEPPATFGAEEREAVEELFRQVLGVVATSIRSRFGEVAFRDDPQQLDGADVTSGTFLLEHNGCENKVLLCLSREMTAAMEAEPATPEHAVAAEPVASRNLDLLMDVHLGVRLRFGSRRMRLREILEIHPGAVVELDRQVQEPVELLVDTKLIAKGEVVIVDGNYGLRINEVVTPRERLESVQ